MSGLFGSRPVLILGTLLALGGCNDDKCDRSKDYSCRTSQSGHVAVTPWVAQQLHRAQEVETARASTARQVRPGPATTSRFGSTGRRST